MLHHAVPSWARISSSSIVPNARWIRSTSDSPALCRAKITTVAVDMESMGKLELVPARWREQFAKFELEDGEFPAGR